MAKREPRCAVCRSSHRAEVELSLANDVSCRIVGNRYGLHKDACWRHKTLHMSPELRARLKATGANEPVDLDKLRITESEGLLQHLIAVRGRLYRALDDAETVGSPVDVARVAGPLHKNLELTAKLLGDLKVGGTVIQNNLFLNSEYHELRTGLVQCLKGHPQARIEVTRLLQGLELKQTQVLEHLP